MESILNLINEYNLKHGNKSFLMGSYVYNKLIKNKDDYDDVDIIVNDADLFYDKIKKIFDKCIIQSGRVGEYGYYSWIKVKCEGFDKTINILDEIDHESLINKRRKELYDFQRILFDGKNFTSMDNKMNVSQVIEDYKNNQYCYQPTNIRDKDKNRFDLKRKNFILCWRDSYVYKDKKQ